MKIRNQTAIATFLLLILFVVTGTKAFAQEVLTNVYGRNIHSLNGKWNVLVDPYDSGRRNKIYENKKAEGTEDFYEYSFENGLRLNVPSDWNSQMPELEYYEGTLWYARKFEAQPGTDQRMFLYFAGVNYRCRVYLNGKEIGLHEGGFTPFQFEITDLVKPSENFLAVEVNNTRTQDAIPAMSFDWWNYGGITRDVLLVTTPKSFIQDYFIHLDKSKADVVNVSVQLSDSVAGNRVNFEIPELEVSESLISDENGFATADFRVKKLVRWSPRSSKLYEVSLATANDKISEQIGFRNIEVRGPSVNLNDYTLFLKSVSFHEEIPQRKGRAFSKADAARLLT